MRDLWGRAWIRRTALFSVLAAVAATVVIVSVDGGGGGHLEANRSQLRKACRGTLPYRDLSHLVGAGRAGELHQHGTLLDPGQQSRSLLDCSLTWGGGRSVTVHAEALVSDVPRKMTVEDLLDGDPGDGLYVAPGTTGRTGGRGAWLVAECVGGLSGRVRPTTDLYVTAKVAPGGEGPFDRAAALADFRTAAHVANAVIEAQHCGGSPLDVPDSVVDVGYEKEAEPGADLRKCRWMGADSVDGLLKGRWNTVGDLLQSPVLSACAGQWDTEAPDDSSRRPKRWQVTGVQAASWAGVLGRTAYDTYEGAGHVPAWGSGDRPSGDKGGADGTTGDDVLEDRISAYARDPQLALWARSVCAGRETYHRVSVLPQLDLTDGRTATLGKDDRADLSRTARHLLDRYLSAPDGWPKSAGCHDTKVLGEAEEWH